MGGRACVRQGEGCVVAVVVPAEGSNKTKLRKTITTLIIKQSRIFGLGFWTCSPPCSFPARSQLPAGPLPSSLPRMHFRNATANAIFGHCHNSFTFYQLLLLLLLVLQWMSWTSRRSLRPGLPPTLGFCHHPGFPRDNRPPQMLGCIFRFRLRIV